MFQNSYSISRNCAKTITRRLPWRSRGKNSPCNAGDRFNPWSRKIPHATEQLSPSASATEALPPVLHNKRNTSERSLCTAMKGAPSSPQLGKAQAQQQRPRAAKNNQYIFNKRNHKRYTPNYINKNSKRYYLFLIPKRRCGEEVVKHLNVQ